MKFWLLLIGSIIFWFVFATLSIHAMAGLSYKHSALIAIAISVFYNGSYFYVFRSIIK